MSGRTRARNQARLVRCSAGCGTLVWLAGALPTASDATFICSPCIAGAEDTRDEVLRPSWMEDPITGEVP